MFILRPHSRSGAPTLQPVAGALLIALTLAVVIAGCATDDRPLQRWEGVSHHMGTEWRIVTWSSSAGAASNGLTAAFARIRELDQRLTDYDPDSELRRLTREPVDRWVLRPKRLAHHTSAGAVRL